MGRGEEKGVDLLPPLKSVSWEEGPRYSFFLSQPTFGLVFVKKKIGLIKTSSSILRNKI